MTKRYLKTAFVYAVIAIVFGVFYREFTKGMAYSGQTALSVMHTHYFMLGMTFFLVLALLEKNFAFSDKTVFWLIVVYHAGLNVAGAAMFSRGLAQVICESGISKGLDGAISGIAGLGHAVLGVALLWTLIKLIKSVKN